MDSASPMRERSTSWSRFWPAPSIRAWWPPCDVPGRAPVGLTGADATVATMKRAAPIVTVAGDRVDLGLVGAPIRNGAPRLLTDLAGAGVCADRRVHRRTRDGQLLNVNADTLASHLASALRARRLVIAGGTVRRARRPGTDDRATHDPRRGAPGEGRHGEQGHGGKAAGLSRSVAGRCWRCGHRRRQEDSARHPGRFLHASYRVHAGGAMKTTLDSIQTRESQYVLHTYRRQPVAFVRGKGPRLYDVDGREYLDFVSGIGVASLGHAHPGLAAVIADQAATLLHTSNLYYHPFQAEAAARLSALSGLSRAFFCNSGTEANEACLKFARRYWHTQGVKDRTAFVAIEHAFAGRTMGALSVTYDEHYRTPFQPLLGPVTFVDPNSPDALYAAVSERTAAIIAEPIRGEGGVRPLPRAFSDAIADVCRRTGTLLIADEVQTGLGRTGHPFHFQALGWQPDLVSVGKALGSGVPVGAALVSSASRRRSPPAITAAPTAEISWPHVPRRSSSKSSWSAACSTTCARLVTISSDGCAHWRSNTRSSSKCAARA